MIVFKLMPADSDADMSRMESDVRARPDVKKVEVEPMAFGLTALKVTVFTVDGEGVSDKIEEELRAIGGVGEVEVLELGRLM